MARKTKRAPGTIVGRLRPADPFELIRWLARSQSDPRKALAELVQNSLDAGAKTVRITRLRDRGESAIQIVDDGEGVIPELGRSEALQYIATHIGYSRKRNLTPEERRELLLQGKYGIGLLGFWAIGKTLEMRTQLPGDSPFLLRMHEEEPRYEIERARGRLSLPERYTEVTVRRLHRPAFVSLSARRIVDYLSAELRGQILAREAQVLVHDRIARGRAPKVLEVRPRRYEGERLALPETVPVEGFSPLRVEIYVRADAPDGERIALSSVGTTVYDDLCDFEADDFRREPWTDPRLTGLVEFPDFRVAPGSRRGVVPDAVAMAFAAALRTLEPALRDALAALERRAAAEIEAGLVRQLERAFRDLPRLAPEYDFFAVRGSGANGDRPPGRPVGGAESGEAAGEAAAPEEVVSPEGLEQRDEQDGTAELLPAGALDTLEILPSSTRVERLGSRRLRAVARDANGTPILREIEIEWSCAPPLGVVEAIGGRTAVFRAGPETGSVVIAAGAREKERLARATATITIVEAMAGGEGARAGIPDPAFVDEPTAEWRSRMRDGRWEVNRAHPDFRVASESPKRKLRYLAALLGKEIVIHSFPGPQLGPLLERLVGVLTIAERRLER